MLTWPLTWYDDEDDDRNDGDDDSGDGGGGFRATFQGFSLGLLLSPII